VPVSLEATFITRTECKTMNDAPELTHVALDYGKETRSYSRSDGSTTYYSASATSNLLYFGCPEAAVAKLTALGGRK
jgi:hypothetical protein